MEIMSYVDLTDLILFAVVYNFFSRRCDLVLKLIANLFMEILIGAATLNITILKKIIRKTGLFKNIKKRPIIYNV